MNINKSKCDAWKDMFIEILNMTKDLTDEEHEYIKANCAIEYGNRKLQELKEKQQPIKNKGRSIIS